MSLEMSYRQTVSPRCALQSNRFLGRGGYFFIYASNAIRSNPKVIPRYIDSNTLMAITSFPEIGGIAPSGEG